MKNISTNLNPIELNTVLEFLDSKKYNPKNNLLLDGQNSFYFEFNKKTYFVHYLNEYIDVLNLIEVEINKNENNKDFNIVTIFADGGSVPNPGECGSGIAVYFDNVYKFSYYGGYLPLGTNNIAELNAFGKAITLAKDFLESGAKKIIIKSDSKYSISCFTEWLDGWVSKGWKTSKNQPVKNKDIIQKIYNDYKEIKNHIEIIHVNGHVGIEGNEISDVMASRAINKRQVDFKICYDDISSILK